ncbi:MAG: hypothetical protein K5985_05405 [Lachnospiraceae bacterium]|nr:hypothetical protein [Lachnospiraceae bacterium]
MGYIADNNAGNVTAEKIASGMNKIFKKLADNPTKSLEEVFDTLVYDIFPESEASKHTLQQVMYDINNGTSAAVDFVRGLMNQVSDDGAGSVIASGGLGAAAEDVLGDSETSSKIYIDTENIYIERVSLPEPGAAGVTIQAGADSASTNRIMMKMFRMTSKDLGLDKIENASVKGVKSGEGKAVNALTMEEATSAIDIFQNAINLVSGVRSYYGAAQNRMEHTIRNLDNIVENTTTSESRLRDTDMASEMVKLALQNILLQAGQSMLSQANQSSRGIMALF